MSNVTVGAKAAARAGVTQAKVIRATGETEYYYSTPRVPWWKRRQRKWVNERLAAFIAQERVL